MMLSRCAATSAITASFTTGAILALRRSTTTLGHRPQSPICPSTATSSSSRRFLLSTSSPIKPSSSSSSTSPISQRRSLFSSSSSETTTRSSSSSWILSAGLLISILATTVSAKEETQKPLEENEQEEHTASPDHQQQQEEEQEEPTTTPPNLKKVWKLAPLYGHIHSKDDLAIELFQYEACPFCCKVKAYLDYHKIPYTIVEVNPIFKREMRDSLYKRVPFMRVNGIQINDSSNIINELHQLLHPGYFDWEREKLSSSNNYEASRKERENELHWRTWVDARLVHLLPPNIYRTYGEAVQAFDYITDVANFSWSQKIAAKWGGSTVMYAVSKRLKTKYNIVDERKELYDCMNLWMDEVEKAGKPFLGGDAPNMADLQVYGVLTSIEGLDTYHDMRKHSRAGVWYDRMKEAVGDSSRLNNFRKNAHNTVTIVK